jgi:hypothetical protein
MNLDRDKIWIRRNHWHAYITPLFLAATVIGIIRACQTQLWQFVFMPVTIIPLWLMLYLTTPKNGMRVKTIRATPGVSSLLCLMASVLVMLALVVAIDIYIFGQSLQDPLQAYHAILFAPPVLTLIIAVLWVSRIQRIHSDSVSTTGNEPSAMPPEISLERKKNSPSLK